LKTETQSTYPFDNYLGNIGLFLTHTVIFKFSAEV